MRGRPILVEYKGKPRSLREVALMIGISPRALNNRWHRGKRGAELFAPPDERMKRRGNWGDSGPPKM